MILYGRSTLYIFEFSRSLNWVTASHLECPFKETEPEIRELIYTAINHVLEVLILD